MSDKGTCSKHGEFILTEGCSGCLAERSTGGAPPSVASTTAEPTTSTAIALRPGEDIEVHGFFQEAQRLLDCAEVRVIVNFEDVTSATESLSLIANVKKAMEAKRKEYLEPLRTQADAIRETYTYLMTPILEADKITKDKMLAFTREQDRIRAEQERINALKLEAAQKEKELKGEVSEPMELVEVQPSTRTTISTDMGTTLQRENWKWEVVDFALVPDEYKMINSGVITPVVKASKGKITIPGIRIFNEPIIAVKTR